MSADRSPGARTRKRVRLWPLMSMPFLGLWGGYFVATARVWPLLLDGSPSLPEAVALGTLTGCALMVAIASAILAYRIAQTRFTIGAILFTIAAVAVLLWLARSIVS